MLKKIEKLKEAIIHSNEEHHQKTNEIIDTVNKIIDEFEIIKEKSNRYSGQITYENK